MQTVIEKKVNNNNLYCLTEDVTIDTVKKFVESGHAGADVFNYDNGYVVSHELVVPALISKCLPSKRVVFVPALPDGVKIDAENLGKITARFSEIYRDRVLRDRMSFNFVHTIAKSTYGEEYANLQLNGVGSDYYFEGVDTGSSRNTALTVGNAILCGRFAKLTYDVRVDESGNPYFFLSVNPMASLLEGIFNIVDDTKKNCNLYMSKIDSELSFAPKGTTTYNTMVSVIKSFNLWTNVLKDCFLDCMIDAVEESLDCKIESYFKDSWSSSGIILEKNKISYFSGIIHPDGKTLLFADKDTNNQYLVETKEYHTFFPSVVQIGKVKDSIVRFVNLSTLKEI